MRRCLPERRERAALCRPGGDCCRRLRGSGAGSIRFHGLTPTAKCCRGYAAPLEPRAGARGLSNLKILCPPAASWLSGHRLSLKSCPPSSVVVPGRAALPGLRPTVSCCRRLRGSGAGSIRFHGLTPTAKCCRRIRGFLEPRAGARPGLARISQCAMERRLLLTGAKPVQQLSLRLVAARADHGGNDMV